MPILDHLWIILALPLAGAAINGLFGKHWSQVGRQYGGRRLCVAYVSGRCSNSFASSGISAAPLPYANDYFTWMIAGTFRVDFSLQVDQLTVVMLLRGDLRGHAHSHLFHGLHGARRAATTVSSAT